MKLASSRVSAWAIGLIIVIFATLNLNPQASAQTGEGWTILLDESNMGEWDRLGETNWRMEDGAVTADNRTSENPAYLISKDSYGSFELYVEFWASDDANSGIFIRCSNSMKVNDHTCYEVNIYDERADPTYGTGGIVNFVEVDPMPKAGGNWNTYEITADGRDLRVVLNGEETAKLRNGLFAEGPFALQHGGGVIKFRKVAIKPL
jgi:hypothetical protein